MFIDPKYRLDDVVNDLRPGYLELLKIETHARLQAICNRKVELIDEIRKPKAMLEALGDLSGQPMPRPKDPETYYFLGRTEQEKIEAKIDELEQEQRALEEEESDLSAKLDSYERAQEVALYHADPYRTLNKMMAPLDEAVERMKARTTGSAEQWEARMQEIDQHLEFLETVKSRHDFYLERLNQLRRPPNASDTE